MYLASIKHGQFSSFWSLHAFPMFSRMALGMCRSRMDPRIPGSPSSYGVVWKFRGTPKWIVLSMFYPFGSTINLDVFGIIISKMKRIVRGKCEVAWSSFSIKNIWSFVSKWWENPHFYRWSRLIKNTFLQTIKNIAGLRIRVPRLKDDGKWKSDPWSVFFAHRKT